MPKVSKSVTINAAKNRVFDVVTDYAAYKDFIPEIESVEIVKKGASSTDVSFEVNLVVRTSYTLRFKPKKYQSVDWSLVKGDYMKSNSGSWNFSSVGVNKTRLTYSTEVEFGWLVPSSVAKALIEDNLPNMLRLFKKRIEGMI